MAQVVGLGPGPVDAGLLGPEFRLDGPPARVVATSFGYVRLQSAEGVDQGPVAFRVHQGPFVVLAVDLDQAAAHDSQGLGADRRVVDVGAGPPVRQLHAPQDEVALDFDVVGARHLDGRVRGREFEHGRHLTLLLAVAHEPAVAPAAERERQRVEQDRLAGAGFPGQHREARLEIEVEPVDQNDVADRQPGQHGNAGVRRGRRPDRSAGNRVMSGGFGNEGLIGMTEADDRGRSARRAGRLVLA